MTSPIRILVKARVIVQKQFCLFHDPRWEVSAIARRADGEPTAPENKPAVFFTPTGAVARAVFNVTGQNWMDQDNLYKAAMAPLMARTSRDTYQFLRICDQWGMERILALFDEAIKP